MAIKDISFLKTFHACLYFSDKRGQTILFSLTESSGKAAQAHDFKHTIVIDSLGDGTVQRPQKLLLTVQVTAQAHDFKTV